MATGLSGVGSAIEKLRRFSVEFPDKVGAALYLEAQIEMTESKRRVPVKTGILRSTGDVKQPVRKGNKVSVDLGYGGAAKAYAIPVHENLTAHHSVGQAKYLESVLNESAPYMISRLARRLDLGSK